MTLYIQVEIISLNLVYEYGLLRVSTLMVVSKIFSVHTCLREFPLKSCAKRAKKLVHYVYGLYKKPICDPPVDLLKV